MWYTKLMEHIETFKRLVSKALQEASILAAAYNSKVVNLFESQSNLSLYLFEVVVEDTVKDVSSGMWA